MKSRLLPEYQIASSHKIRRQQGWWRSVRKAMDGESSPPGQSESSDGQEKLPPMSQLKKGFLSVAASVQESVRCIKPSVVGQAKKLKAKDEKEASDADIQAAKMQVEAADKAERTKSQLDS